MSDLWGWHFAAADDYRDSHQAPGPEDGAPMHDVTQGIYPATFYDEPFRYWGTDESTGDRDSWGTIHKVRGNPDARVKVHRALPLDVAKRERGIGLAAPLNTGDWVTPSYDYAHEHGMSRLEGNTPWTVVTSTVPASQLHTNGDSLAEWGYNGPPTQGYEGANAAGKRKYRQQVLKKQQAEALIQRNAKDCEFCEAPAGTPCPGSCYGKKHYPGDRDAPIEHTASTDGVRYAHLVEADVADDLMKLAMPAPLPKGTYFRYHPELVWSPGVTAHAPGGKMVGSLEWYDDDHVMVDLGTRRPGEIDRIQVPEDHRGQSIATSMFDFAKQHEPRLHHSDQLTPDGRGWSQYEQNRHARLAMAWDEWAPNIQHEAPQHDGDVGLYHVDHQGGRKSYLRYRPDGDSLKILYLMTDAGHRRDGVAESLIRRMNQDHPDHKIDPGALLEDGQGFHDRMLEKEPEARGVVTARA